MLSLIMAQEAAKVTLWRAECRAIHPVYIALCTLLAHVPQSKGELGRLPRPQAVLQVLLLPTLLRTVCRWWKPLGIGIRGEEVRYRSGSTARGIVLHAEVPEVAEPDRLVLLRRIGVPVQDLQVDVAPLIARCSEARHASDARCWSIRCWDGPTETEQHLAEVVRRRCRLMCVQCEDAQDEADEEGEHDGYTTRRSIIVIVPWPLD